MEILLGKRSVLVLLLLCMCVLVTYGKGGKIIINTGGRGRGSRGRYRGSMYSRSNNRGSSSRYRNSQSHTRNVHQSASQQFNPEPRPSAYDDAIKRLEYSPTFKELNPNHESLRFLYNSKQRSRLHSGHPPPYSSDGETQSFYKPKQPNIPVEQPPPYSFPGKSHPYPQQPDMQPPPYPKDSGQPSSHLAQPPPPYPGLSSTFRQSGHSSQYAVYPLALGSQQYLSQLREPPAHRIQSGYPGNHAQKLGGSAPFSTHSATYQGHSASRSSRCKDENFLKKVINKFDYCDIETTSITGYLSIEKCCQLLMLNGVI